MRLNSFNAIGRLTKDPVLREHEDPKKASCLFYLAVSRGDKRDSGADFIPCVIWGEYGRVCAQHLTKGKEIMVSGNVRTNSTQDEEGNYSNYWEVRVDTCSFGADTKNQKSQSTEEVAEAPATLTADMMDRLVREVAAQITSSRSSGAVG